MFSDYDGIKFKMSWKKVSGKSPIIYKLNNSF
jgi:hypothetical protein